MSQTQKHSKPSENTEQISKSYGNKIGTNISNAFIALHSYKPQKPDELELMKGCKCSCPQFLRSTHSSFKVNSFFSMFSHLLC